MKLPIVTRHQLDKAKAKLAEAKKKIASLKEKNAQLKSERNEARSVAKKRAVDIAAKSRNPREILATALEGEGIEIGALHFPLPVPERVTVRYVDMSTREENIRKYPHLNADDIVETHFVCNGETLEVIEDESQDFVIANHMLEHCINPIGTLRNFLRVLRPGGLLFLALPDKRFSFDRERPITPFSHIADDFRIDRKVEDLSVYEDWTTHVRKNGDPVQLHKEQKNIHFHVWTQAEILEMFVEARRTLELPLEIEWSAKNGGEFITLLRKYDGEDEERDAARESAAGMRRP